MSTDTLVTLLRQNELLVLLSPFQITHVTVDVPNDELVNDVTVYLNKESQTTLETLSEIELQRLGQSLLEDVYLYFAAPSACSLHMVYQFYDPDPHQYVDDHRYHIGEWWIEFKGYWVAKSLLDMYYDERHQEEILYKTWWREETFGYRPHQSPMLLFATDADVIEFVCERLGQSLNVPLNSHSGKTNAHSNECAIYLDQAEKDAFLQLGEYKALGITYQLYDFVQRYYGRDESCEFIIQAYGQILMYFQSSGKRLFYRTWLDSDLIEVKRSDRQLIFRGPSQRQFIRHLRKRLGRLNIPDGVTISTTLPTEQPYTVIVVVDWPEMKGQLRYGSTDVLWDVYQYFDPPPETYCYLNIELPSRSWYVEGRIKRLEARRSYRSAWRTNRGGWNRWGGRDVFVRPLLTEVTENVFGRDWAKDDYAYDLDEVAVNV